MPDPREQSASAESAEMLVEALRRAALREGFSRLGIAAAGPPPRQDLVRRWLDKGFAGVMRGWFERQMPLRADPDRLLPGVKSVIMLATDHATHAGTPRGWEAGGETGREWAAAEADRSESAVASAGTGRLARYAWGDDYHALLRRRVNALAAWLEARVPGCRTRGVVDSAPLAEREFARLAGLGWFGKNTMLIDPRAGSYFFLTALLTDLELPAGVPVEVDHCGTCTACLDACPTGALTEPRLLDASRCISTLTIEDRGPIPAGLRGGMQDWIFGCDVCQEVCPWNRHAPGSDEPAFQPRNGEIELALVDVLQLDDAGFRHRFAGSPVLRAKRSGLVRSAAIALGNRPDPAAFAALAAAVADAEPVVRGAAAWALGQWRQVETVRERARATLVARLAVECDPAVRSELEAAVARHSSSVSSTSADGSRPGPSTP